MLQSCRKENLPNCARGRKYRRDGRKKNEKPCEFACMSYKQLIWSLKNDALNNLLSRF